LYGTAIRNTVAPAPVTNGLLYGGLSTVSTGFNAFPYGFGVNNFNNGFGVNNFNNGFGFTGFSNVAAPRLAPIAGGAATVASAPAVAPVVEGAQ
jgi:hypothetical protein